MESERYLKNEASQFYHIHNQGMSINSKIRDVIISLVSKYFSIFEKLPKDFQTKCLSISNSMLADNFENVDQKNKTRSNISKIFLTKIPPHS